MRKTLRTFLLLMIAIIFPARTHATIEQNFVAHSGPAEAIASRDKRSIIVKCNGEQGKTVFHDGDSVTLDFEYGNSISHVDSMKWDVELTDIFDRKLRYTLSKETTASFVVAPDKKCCFAKSAYKQFNFMGGDYWFCVPHIVPDSCRFICTAYYKDWIYNTQISVISKNYSFDVLPECPTIEELETWVVPGDEEWPISKIRINTSNYEDIQVYVSPWDYIDYQAKVLFEGDSLEFCHGTRWMEQRALLPGGQQIWSI